MSRCRNQMRGRFRICDVRFLIHCTWLEINSTRCVDCSYLGWLAQRVRRSRLLWKLGHQDSDALTNVAQHL
jgi:hypothetical protein